MTQRPAGGQSEHKQASLSSSASESEGCGRGTAQANLWLKSQRASVAHRRGVPALRAVRAGDRALRGGARRGRGRRGPGGGPNARHRPPLLRQVVGARPTCNGAVRQSGTQQGVRWEPAPSALRCV